MNLFISWSRNRSRLLAQGLHHWLPLILNNVTPWLSSDDIHPGSRWGLDLAGQLERTSFGIICLTAENLDSTWINFEAGALSREITESHVVPLLLDNKPADIQGPLTQFQAIQATKSDILKLLAAINSAMISGGENGREKDSLEELFEALWPIFEKVLISIPPREVVGDAIELSNEEMFKEILDQMIKLQEEIHSVKGAHSKRSTPQRKANMNFQTISP